jgi:pimeloyl-ACP methyl ester carboxylesterase
MAESQIITMVLVHGAFAESLSSWKPVLELLLAKGYKVVAAPNPLRGVSTAAPILLADGSRDLYFQPDKFRAQYAADLPETETKLLALTQRPMAERAMTEVSDVPAWIAIPSWFIFGMRDNAPDRRRPSRLKVPHTPS